MDGNGNIYMTGHSQSSDFPTTGGGDATLGAPQDAFVVRLLPELPTVSIAATDPNAGEPATGSGISTFTANASFAPTSNITINYTVAGTAAAGADYTALSGTVTIAAGATTATIPVTVIDNNAVESDETVIVTLATGTGYTVGAPDQATVTIADDDATVTIAASDANAGEPGAGSGGGIFTVTRAGFTTGALDVAYTASGTAAAGADYTTLPGTVTIAAGATTAVIPVTVIDDSAVESSETVIVTLAAGTGYTISAPPQATVTIADDEPAAGGGSKKKRCGATGMEFLLVLALAAVRRKLRRR